jgi:hypothetical protein
MTDYIGRKLHLRLEVLTCHIAQNGTAQLTGYGTCVKTTGDIYRSHQETALPHSRLYEHTQTT